MNTKFSVLEFCHRSPFMKQRMLNVYDQIAHLSEAMTLEPGDLIFTGTPGVRWWRDAAAEIPQGR
jgi:Fumarylacetoacetate (FAA) hydrolase family